MSSAFTTAPPPSSSAPASMETLVALLGRVVARFEARLEAQEQRLAMANTTPRPEPEPDPLFGRPLTSWDLPRPRISPELCSNRSDWNHSVPHAFDLPPQQPAYLESYGGRGYNDYYNNEPLAWSNNNYESQAWSYNTFEPDRYNYVPQQVWYEPSPPAHYYSIAELPPQQQHYYPPPPSYTQAPDVDATLESDVNDSEARVDARRDEIAAEPPFEDIGEEESTPMVDPKVEVADADASYKQQLSEMQTDPNAAERVLDEMMELIDNPQTVVNNQDKAIIWIESWGESSNELHCLPVYEETCKSWKSKGVRLPALDEESRAPAFTLARSVEETNKKGEGSRKKRLKSREIPRRLVIFGLYALAEVYKVLLNLHLEDKVILKGGGVDTLFILIN